MKSFLILSINFLFLASNITAQEKIEETVKGHQFDFWIGDWNVYKFGTDTIVGVSSIKPILNHTSIEENYQSLPYTYKGRSFNVYNAKKGHWEQFWVDNSGLVLHMLGDFKGNQMTLTDCESQDPCNRIVWTNQNDGTVRQEWTQSKDSGKSWNKVFDGHYKKRK